MTRILLGKLVALGRDEDGAALVTTLAMFFFMFTTIAALTAFGTAVRERIRLQNACDAAAYSAAVEQADTFSRVAAMNRQMSWTYVQMTRRQLDYIVMKLLDRSCAHFKQDRKTAEKFSKGAILACSAHKQICGGWFIGANGKLTSVDRIQVNGLNTTLMPSLPLFGHYFNLGGGEFEKELEGFIETTGAANLKDLLKSGDKMGEAGLPQALAVPAAKVLKEFAWVSADPLDAETLATDAETVLSIKDVLVECADSGRDKASLGRQVTQYLNMLKTQILSDRLTIATLNLAERKLVREMPRRIETNVVNVLRANLPERVMKGCLYRVVQEEHPLASERQLVDVDDPTSFIPGYFRNLHNNHADERYFLSWSGYDMNKKKVCDVLGKGGARLDVGAGRVAAGIDQWFVRGNGKQRTEGMIGFQRGYKHWAEHHKDKAKNNPYVPSCWNEEHLHESPKSIALYCEWQWWADRWTCPWFPIVGRLHFPIRSWGLTNSKCGFGRSPGKERLAFVKSKIDWIKEIGNIMSFYRGATKGVHDCANSGDDEKTSRTADKEKPCPMKNYKDGCLLAYEIPPVTLRAIPPYTAYARVYADDPKLFNRAYVGECAKPLVLKKSYFGANGTITVGVACKTANAWGRFADVATGIYSIFNPSVGWSWAFASAKAGYRDPDADVSGDDQGERRLYRVHWDLSNGTKVADDGKKPWNLVMDDWDAVMVPVRQAKGFAAGKGDVSAWVTVSTGFLSDWIRKGWKGLDGKEAGEMPRWDEIGPPPGMVAGDSDKSGKLDWKGLADAMYH